MSRLRQVPRAEVTAPIIETMYDYMFGDRDPVAEPGTDTGSPGDWWTVFANDAAVFEHAVRGFGVYRGASIDPVLRELAQARVGWAVGSRFVFSQHAKMLRGVGVSEERIAAVPAWSTATCFDEVERLVLSYADCLVLGHGRVPDDIFEGLQRHLSDAEVLELTYISGLYLMHGVMSRALRLEFDDVDEAITEVPLPEGADAASILGDDR